MSKRVRSCLPRMPDIGVSSIVSPVRPSVRRQQVRRQSRSTALSSMTRSSPFSQMSSGRTPSWNAAASLLRFALASRLLRIMLCSSAAVGGICSRNSSIPSTERFECRKRHEPSIKMDVIPPSTAAEPDGWMDWCWEGRWRPLDARFTTAKSERAILANSGHSPQLYFILQP